MSETDHRLMTMALTLAGRGLGRVWPNPAVGCVIAAGEQVLGRGWTQPGGRPHAETVALTAAGPAARGATAYVTLEPCCHHGQTPPCADALIAAGIARVVAACVDPDPRVAGGGLARLRAAGIAVEHGLAEVEAHALNHGFFLRVTEGRPLVTLKLAGSLDGRIATAAGASQWITDQSARAAGHGLRARHDAIMVGIGTVLADNPSLTCRLPGLEGRSPIRVVLDSGLRLPPTSALAATAGVCPTWVITSFRGLAPAEGEQRSQALRAAGVTVLGVAPAQPDSGYTDQPVTEGAIPPHTALAALAARGITRVLCEGGSRLAAALLRERLVDRIAWFQAPLILGGDGLAAVAPFGVRALEQAARFDVAGPPRRLGPDLLVNLVQGHEPDDSGLRK